MRLNLKVFRTKQNMTQSEFADKIGVNRTGYSLVEQGKRNGTMTFWNKLKDTFNLSADEMWSLTKNEEE